MGTLIVNIVVDNDLVKTSSETPLSDIYECTYFFLSDKFSLFNQINFLEMILFKKTNLEKN